MPIKILMPALSPTMEKGNLAKWLKKEGDTVKSGDVIAEIETDKATMEVEAVDEGMLAKILVPEGTADVPVNEPIALIAGEGEDPRASRRAAAGGPRRWPRRPQRRRRASAELHRHRSSAQPHAAAAPAASAAAAKPNGGAGQGGRVFASPLAKRMAKEAGIDLAAIQGSGPHGRIVEKDVESRCRRRRREAAPRRPQPRRPAAKPRRAALARAMGADQVKAMFEAGTYEEIPLDGMRKTIAKRLVESKQTVPHFYLTLDCELDALHGAARADQRRRAEGQGRQARLQALGQRLRHQGAGHGAAAGAGRQRRCGRRIASCS